MAWSGYDVTREYYINDAGGQITILAQSTLLRYREALGETVEIPPGLYPGDYLVPVGQALKAEFGTSLLDKPEAEVLPLVKERVLAAMMELIKADLAKLNIHHDVFFSERTLHGQGGDIDTTLDWLRSEGMVYQGRLEPPKGKTPEDWEDREQTLFRATDYGDDTDRALIKSDGSYTYFAADIAYHRNKYLRGFKHMVNVLGADHSGYVKRLGAAVKAVSHGEADIDVRICQLVRLLKNGEPFKMSKRSGDLVTLADVVEEVGPMPPASCCCSGATTRRWISTSPSSRNRRATIRSSTCNTPMPAPARCSAPPRATCPGSIFRLRRSPAQKLICSATPPISSSSGSLAPGRARSPRPLWPTNRIAWPSTRTSLQQLSTGFGPRVGLTIVYDLLTSTTQG